MMLIICDKSPDKAVDWLVENTNKKFCFKQLLELGQLISSAIQNCLKLKDTSFVKIYKNFYDKNIKSELEQHIYKPVLQGKEIQKWILENPFYSFAYYCCLMKYCLDNVNISEESKQRLFAIQEVFNCYNQMVFTQKLCDQCLVSYNFQPYDEEEPTKITTAILRYSKEYSSEYPTDSELPIEVVCELYKKYINWKLIKNKGEIENE